MTTRVLILTASVGEGHDLPARTLADQLRAQRGDVRIVTTDALEAMGPVVRAVSADAATVVFYRFEWVWDLGFWFFAGPSATRLATQALLTRAGAPGLLRAIARAQPDVIVSTYPNVTEVLGRLRQAGRIQVPVCAAITDLAALHYWATPGADVHLVTHPESIEEVRRIVGPRAEVHCVHGLTAPEFMVPRSQAGARADLGLPSAGKVVIASGGGWGVGDVDGAVDAALGFADVSQVVCLCGRNEALRLRLAGRAADEPRLRVEGFTDRMPDWLAAADVLVHSTGGLTVLEALLRGCAPVSYGWGRGHVRLNNAAYRRFGLADVAATRADLPPVLARALARGRRVPEGLAGLPSAASFVLAAADRRIASPAAV